MNEIRTSGPLLFTEPNNPTRVGEIINTLNEIYDIPMPRLGMSVYVKDEGVNYTITKLEPKLIDGVLVPDAKVAGYELQTGKSIAWNSSSNVNDYVVAGVYNITGERLNVNDGLPIANSNPGHTISARLVVLDSSIKGTGDSQDKCITQVLTLSNRTGEDGNMYIRTGHGGNINSLSWEPWATLQTNTNVDQVEDLDNLKDNGIYSGVWTKGYNAAYPLTFVCIVINDYFIGIEPRRISQFVYGLSKLDGSTVYQSRVWDDSRNAWGDWEILNQKKISSMISMEIAKLVDKAPENLDTLKELAEWIENHGTEAANMLVAINANARAIANEAARATEAESDLNEHISQVEESVNEMKTDFAETKKNIASSLHTSGRSDSVNIIGKSDVGRTTFSGDIPAATTEKAGIMTAEDKGFVGHQQSINIVRSAYTDYKIVLPKGCVITDLGGYDGNLFLSTAYPYDNNSRVILNKDLLPFDVPIDVQSIYLNKDIDSTIIIETGLRAASLDVEKNRAFKCVVIASGYGANSYIPVNSLVAMDKGRVLVSVQGATLPKHLWLGAAGSSQADATKIAVTELPFVLPFDAKKLWLDISTLSQPVSLITISADSEEYRELVQDKRIASIENNLAELTPRSYAMPRISGDMPDGTVLTLEKNSVKTFKSLAFSADIVSFGEDGRLLLGHGRESENRYGASWVEVDSKYLVVKTWLAAGSIQERYYEHGLTLSGNIQVLMSVGAGSLSVKISSGGASYEKGELEWNCNGTIFAETMGCELSNASLSWACKNITADIWAFGDSYFGTTNESRWIKHLLDAGYHNILVNGYAGEASSDALADLNALLQHGTPKYIFWCLGMNNADTSTAVNSTWKSVLESVKALCNENGIELVLATIPTVPSRVNKYKNAVVRSSGYRFVDFDKAVGADEETGSWYDGMLSSDGVHPSSKGAVALFHRAIADFPELMMAKRMEL